MPTPWRRRLSRIALAIAVVVAVLALPWALAAPWPWPWSWPRQWDSPIIIAVAADAALVLLAAIWWLWWRLPNFRKTAGRALGGAAVLIGAVVAYLQFTQQQQPAYQPILPQQRAAEDSPKAANDPLISNQVSKGFEQLAGKETAMRLGGIYALEGVMKTSKQYRQPVLEALCAFARNSTTHQQVTLTTFLAALFPAGRDKTAGKGDSTPATDVQAALTVIGRRNPGPGRVDLSGVNIPRVDLSEAQLADAYLMAADLEGADLYGAHLKGAFLNGAHLEGAHLNGAHLEGATLHEAHLEGAILDGAHLEGSDLSSADGLTQAQLEEAEGDAETALPKGLIQPAHWMAR